MAKKQFKQILSEDKLYLADELYTKEEVDNKIGSAIHYKGSVATYADLPPTGQQVGDMWNVKATGKNYVWAENPELKDPPEPGWDDISTTVDLSDYYTKEQTDSGFATKGELTTLSGTVTNHTGDGTIHVTQADKAAWNGKQAKIEVSGILKGNGSGGVSAAVAGTDYVAPVAGKGLSTEDYTTADKQKLDGIEAGAEENVIESIKIDNTTLTPSSKTVTIPKGDTTTLGAVKLVTNVHADLSEVDPDAAISEMTGYLIGQSVNGKQAKITANGILKGNGNGSVSAAVAGTDYVAPSALDNYVPTSRKVNNKALSSDIELDGGDITTTYQHGDTMNVQTVDEAFTRTMTQIEGVRTLANGKIANAVSKVKVGSTTISTSGEDTLEIVGSGSVTVTPDATNKKLTISSSSAVTSVNSKTGAVVLTASDVGAAESTHTHAITDVTNLQSTLNGKVDKSTLTTYLTTDSSTGVLKAFPTENYTIEQLITHYNNLLTALRNMVGTLS